MQEIPDNSLVMKNVSSIEFTKSTQIIGDRMLASLFVYISFITSLFVIVGVLGNITNILVFWRLGFSTCSNISLTALSIVDLNTVIFTALMLLDLNQVFVLYYGEDTLAIVTAPVLYSSMAVSFWITAIISLERCCCILFPLKVKLIFTRRTVLCLMVVMLMYQAATVIPHYLFIGLVPVTSPLTNRTILDFDFFKYNSRLGILFLMLSFSIPTFACFFIVSIGTILLVVKLRESAEFRSSMAVNRPEKISTKEMTLARSVAGICGIYIVCFTPNVLTYSISFLFPSFHVLDPVYGNATRLIVFLNTFLQTVSASINVFVYLRMMTQFREIFKRLFKHWDK